MDRGEKRDYSFRSYANGGWGVDCVEKTWDFVGDVGYRFKMGKVSSKVFAGYRYLHIDYEKQPVKLKVDVKGPFVGIGGVF